MPVIGLRCYTEGFSWVVLQGTQQSPQRIANERFSFPVNCSRGAKLAWLRKQIFELLRQHEITAAGIKTIESNARQKPPKRFEVEGVVQEAVHALLSCDCKPRIMSQLRRDIADFDRAAKYLGSVLTERGLSELNNENFKDAALAAIAELPTQE